MLKLPHRKILTESELGVLIESGQYSKLPAAYQIYHHKTGKYYVGSTDDYTQRQYRHEYCLRRGTHVNRPLQRAYDEDPQIEWFGWITETREEAEAIEQEFLDYYHPIGVLFNRSPKADSVKGMIWVEESKAKVRGRKQNPEHAASSRVAFLGHTHSQTTKQKMSLASIKKWKDPDFREKVLETRAANPPSEEARERYRAGGRMNAKPISIDNVIYPSITEAAISLGLCCALVVYRLKSKKSKYSAWFYLEDNPHPL
jgi:group I intron endonuclease